MVHSPVVEELAWTPPASQFRLIASVGIPSGYSTRRSWQTGKTRVQTVVLLLVAGRQLLGQVFVKLTKKLPITASATCIGHMKQYI